MGDIALDLAGLGAALTDGTTHIAISGSRDGQSMAWMEHDTDEPYAR